MCECPDNNGIFLNGVFYKLHVETCPELSESLGLTITHTPLSAIVPVEFHDQDSQTHGYTSEPLKARVKRLLPVEDFD